MSEQKEQSTVIESEYLPVTTRYSPLAFALISLVLVFISYQLVGGGIAYLIAGKSESNVTLFRIVMMAAQFVFLLIPTLWLMKRQHGKISEAISFRIPTLKEIIFAVLGLIALLQLLDGYLYFQNMIPIPEELVPWVDLLKKTIEDAYKVLVQANSIPEMFFVVAVVSFTPAICEEILFRGLVQKNISLAKNSVVGFIVTGTIFGLYHFNPFLVLPLIMIGIYLSFLQYRAQSIVLPMIIHFVNNTISVVAVFYSGYQSSNEMTLLGAMDTTPLSSVLGLIVLSGIIFAAAMWFFINVTEQNIQKIKA